MLTAIAVIVASAISIMSLKFFVIPYAWICFAWCLAFVYVFKRTKSNKLRIAFYNASAILLIFGVIEIFLYVQDREMLWLIKQRNSVREECRNEEGELLTTRREEHDILGYVPMKKTIFQKRYYGDELICDISFTIEDNGLRLSPPYREESESGSILFFGCSYTFGHGVNDNETMPYLVGLKTGGRYRVYNFAWCGYGPHQMLASFEHGLVSDIIECEPAYVIYTAIIDHAFRCAGRAIWDTHGPKYMINENGEAVYQGHFDDGKIPESLVCQKAKNQLRKSCFISRVFLKLINSNDIRLMVGIIDGTKRFLEKNHPGCEFHMIFWDKWKMSLSEEVLSGLKEKGIRVHLVSDILPDYCENKVKYQLSEVDDHPNKLAYELIAEYISNNIISKQVCVP
jgi:hypothetical protein